MTTTEPTPEAIEELARVFGEHWWAGMAESGAAGEWECACGEPLLEMSDEAHERHVAHKVLAAGYETPAVFKGVMACWKVDMRLAREAEDKVKRVEALLADWRSLPVYPDECGEMVLDGVHRDELLTDLRHALDGTERPRPTRTPKGKRS